MTWTKNQWFLTFDRQWKTDPLFLGIWDKNEYLKTWKIKKRIPQNAPKIPWNVSGNTSKRSENTLKLPQNYVFIPENLIVLKNTYFSWSSFKFDQKYTGKYHKIMIISMKKSLILTSSSEKFSPSGVPLPGDSLTITRLMVHLIVHYKKIRGK